MRSIQRKPAHDLAIQALAPPKRVYLSLDNVMPVVAAGQTVDQGQLVARSPDGSPSDRRRHASLSGRVVGIEQQAGRDANRHYHLVIEGTPTATFPDGHREIHAMDSAEIRHAARRAGVVGMGGAMFPTYVKLARTATIQWVLVNGCESEPYLSCDHRVLLEHADEVRCGMEMAIRATGASQGTVVTSGEQFVDGYEPLLIRRVLGRKIPQGGLPRDVGVVVINVQTARALHQAICHDRPVVDRVITVAGDAVARPGNYLVPIGTKVEHILDCCGVTRQRVAALLAGGPMTGMVVDEHSVVTPGTGGVLALTADEIATKRDDEPCIRCGECQEACPFLLPVYQLVRQPSRAVLYCIECGSCEYVCPSERPLVANLKKAKMGIQSANQQTNNN